MLQLIYLSYATSKLSEGQLNQLLHLSRERNLHHNITGMLVSDKIAYLQVLEGKKTDVLNIYRSIKNDTRNNNHTLLLEREINSRSFENSLMGYKLVEKKIFKELYELGLSNIDGLLGRLMSYDKLDIRTILELAGDGIHILDKDGYVIECSQSFASSLGYTKEEALMLNVKDWEACIPEDDIPDIINKLLYSPKTFETKHRRKDGSVIDVEINAKGISLNGELYLYASSRDITERLKAIKEIEILARTDQLTGLANRHKFFEQFRYNLDLASREKRKLILILIDIDKFKFINDNYGHLVGDEALRHVANLLSMNCRKYDLVSRVGGDEFAVLLIHAELKRAIEYIDNLIIEIKKPFKTNNKEVSLGLSIGVSMYPDHEKTISGLLTKADIALYNAKNTGRAKYLIFKSDKNE